MLRPTLNLLKKGWTYSPGRTHRGGKNVVWKPKMPQDKLEPFLPLAMEHPPRRLKVWNDLEFQRVGMVKWPKEVGFFNAGDNFELTPEMMWRLFQCNKDEDFWTQQHNEKVIVHQMPLVECDPKKNMPRVDAVFLHHVGRFGADHVIYNAVMQACAFAKDVTRCEKTV